MLEPPPGRVKLVSRGRPGKPGRTATAASLLGAVAGVLDGEDSIGVLRIAARTGNVRVGHDKQVGRKAVDADPMRPQLAQQNFTHVQVHEDVVPDFIRMPCTTHRSGHTCVFEAPVGATVAANAKVDSVVASRHAAVEPAAVDEDGRRGRIASHGLAAEATAEPTGEAGIGCDAQNAQA